MKLLEYFLTKTITTNIMDKAAVEGMKESESHRVEQVPFLKLFFRGIALMGLIIAVLSLFVWHEPIASLIFLLLFGGLSVPVLISYHTCWISYDDYGFTISNFGGVKHHYSYEDVTGIADNAVSVEIEVCGKKRISLNEIWVNRYGLVRAICKNRSKKPPKIVRSVLGMSLTDIVDSYKNGVLKQALLVSEKNESRMSLFKGIHYFICTFSVILMLFCFFSMNDKNISMTFFCAVLLNNILMLSAILLYFRYPEYFTVREKPESCHLDKNCRKYHKLCTQAWVSLLSFFSNALFWASSISVMQKHSSNWLLTAISIAFPLILFIVMIVVFRRFSWEYREFRVGFVSFTFWQLFYCLGLFLMIYSLIMY